MQKYRKFIIAFIGAVVTILVQQNSGNDIVQAAIPLLTALGVYTVPNIK